MTKTLIGEPPRLPGDPLTYAITVRNTGQTTIVVLPLEDEYDPELIAFLSADPSSDDTIDDGLLTWSDLTVPLGDLAPGDEHTVLAEFQLVQSRSGLEIQNLGTVPGAMDELGRLMTGEDDDRLILRCTDLELMPTDIQFDPPAAVPGDQVSITVTVSNIGLYDVTNGILKVEYEATPLDPEDDPNWTLIGGVPFQDLASGSSIQLELSWDTTGLPAVGIPVIARLDDIQPEQCNESNDSGVTLYTVPVTLSGFTARAGEEEVILDWVTETEIQLFGWRIYRSDRFDAGYERLDLPLIPGHGTTYTRNEYRHVDTDVVPGMLYFYRLESVDLDGSLERFGTVAASPGEGSGISPILQLDTNRGLVSAGDRLALRARMSTGAQVRSVHFGLWLLLNGQVLGEVIPPTLLELPADLDTEASILEHRFTGAEPTGEYTFFGVLINEEGSQVLSTALTSFHNLTDH